MVYHAAKQKKTLRKLQTGGRLFQTDIGGPFFLVTPASLQLGRSGQSCVYYSYRSSSRLAEMFS